MSQTGSRVVACVVALSLAVGLAACSGEGVADRIESNRVVLAVDPLTVLSPSGDRSVIYGGEDDPQLTYSAGFMQRVGLGEINGSSDLSWAPDSRSFYVNDSGHTAWSELRLWRVGGRQAVQEISVVRQAAIQQLALHNRCPSPDRMEYTTRALGWGEGGQALYVLTMWRRQVNCPVEIRVSAVVSRIVVSTGEVEQTLSADDARLQWPGLPMPEPDPVPERPSATAP